MWGLSEQLLLGSIEGRQVVRDLTLMQPVSADTDQVAAGAVYRSENAPTRQHPSVRVCIRLPHGCCPVPALPRKPRDKVESLQHCGSPAEAGACLQCGLDVDQVGLHQGLELTQGNLDKGWSPRWCVVMMVSCGSTCRAQTPLQQLTQQGQSGAYVAAVYSTAVASQPCRPSFLCMMPMVQHNMHMQLWSP